MAGMTRTALTAALAACAALAGCATDTPPGDAPAEGGRAAAEPLGYVLDGEGYRLSRPLTANDTLDAPMPWRVGDWYGVHVNFGAEDAEGTHYNTIIVDENADEWVLATDNQLAAKQEAVFDIPILGPFRKDDLGTSGFGGRWDLYEFPLADGASWVNSVALDDGAAVELEYQATFDGRIATPYGTFAGYRIQAVDGEARPVLAYDYVPEIGWFTTFAIYDTATQEPDDVLITARSMGHGSGWRGTYYQDEAAILAQHLNVLVLDPNAAQLQPGAPTSFTVSEDATYLFGFVFSFAFGGAHETYLVDPNNQPREFRAVGMVAVDEQAEAFIDEPALPGDWRIVTAGAGVAAGGGVFLWEVTETAATL